MFRRKNNSLEFFLAHPGGPFFKNKDEGAWTIPKGEVEEKDENDLLKTAKREFREETGISPKEELIPLGHTTLKSGKIIHAWAFESDWNGLLECQTFVNLEFPAKSGKYIKFPEVDKAGFFPQREALRKINPAQRAFIENLQKRIF